MLTDTDRSMPTTDFAPSKVVVFGSPDVLATIGRKGLLEERVGAHRIEREKPCRSDVLREYLTHGYETRDLSVPSAVARTMVTRANDADVKVVILSLEPDLVGPAPWRHRQSGRLVQPPTNYAQSWPTATVDWLHHECDPCPQLPAEESLKNLSDIAGLLLVPDRSVIFFNVSTYDPTDRSHRFDGASDTFGIRAHRMVAGLEHLATDLRLEIVDVDGAVAEVGAHDNVPEPGRIGGAAIEFVTDEAIRAIDESGALSATIQAPVMGIRVPQLDRRTQDGVISHWHRHVGDEVNSGDILFDVEFTLDKHRFDDDRTGGDAMRARRLARTKKKRAVQIMSVSVVAGADAHLRDVVVPEGTPVAVGDVVAIVTTGSVDNLPADQPKVDFRVVAQATGR